MYWNILNFLNCFYHWNVLNTFLGDYLFLIISYVFNSIKICFYALSGNGLYHYFLYVTVLFDYFWNSLTVDSILITHYSPSKWHILNVTLIWAVNFQVRRIFLLIFNVRLKVLVFLKLMVSL